MKSYDIALTGLKAAATAMDTVGNNIANASTDGYHRQRVNLSPIDSAHNGPKSGGNGVEVAGIIRMVDTILEAEIRRQESTAGQIDRELATLTTMESIVGELASDGALSTLTDEMFAALQDLSIHAEDDIYRQQFINAATALADRFNSLSASLTAMQTNVYSEAEATVDQINELSREIAALNQSIQDMTIAGNTANSLTDQRDALVKQMAQLIGITTSNVGNGVVSIQAGGIPLVSGMNAQTVKLGYATTTTIGLALSTSSNYQSTIEGGKMGGLVTSYNGLIKSLQDDLNTLAKAFVDHFNQIHVQGAPADGGFSSLTGWQVDSATDSLDSLGLGIGDGTVYVRITDSSGQTTRHAVTIDASADSLTDVATDLNALTGLTASVASNKLVLTADAGYSFDFMPAPVVDDSSGLSSSTSSPSVSGLYTGSSNDTLTFTVSAGGTVGNGTVTVTVTDSAGDTVTTLALGSGYAAGSTLDLGNGIRVAFGTGTLVAGESFTVEALADSDTADFLSAVGINAFFTGTSASSIGVLSRFTTDPSQLATALTADYTDNANVERLQDLADTTLSDLNNKSLTGYYHSLISNLGQDVAAKRIRSDNLSTTLQNLNDQQSNTSGVDINEETAMVLVYEHMYQGVAQYLGKINDMLSLLAGLIR